MATYTVTTVLDELDIGTTFEELSTGGLSLREAVELANASAGADIITFEGTVFTGDSASLIRLTMGEIEITDAVTIDGSTATGVTITGDAAGDDMRVVGSWITDVAASSGADLLADNSRVFYVGAEADTTFDSLTITGGRTTGESDGGAGILSQSALTIMDSTVSGNSTSGNYAYGGGISGGTVTLTDTTVSGNATSGFGGSGGGVFAGTVTLTDSTVSGNATSGDYAYGGGINAESVTLTGTTVSGNSTGGHGASGGGIESSSATLTLSVVSDNSTAGDYASGGGIDSGSVTLTDSTISGNTTSGYESGGGGINSYGDVTLTNSTVRNNVTSGSGASGGGIYSEREVTLTGSTVSGNATNGYAAYGGGIDGESGVTLTGSTISDNSTAGDYADGGGLHSWSAVTLTGSTVSNNTTSGYGADGGGISGDSVTLTGSTVSSNTINADGVTGGGISGGLVSLINSTVSGNSADGAFSIGGGIYGENVYLTSSTVSGNSADGGEGGGGGVHAFSLQLENSIVLGNSSAVPLTPEVVDAYITAHGLNIIGTGSDTDGSDGIINADPTAVFGSTYANGAATAGVLADNGGPVQTIALLADITNPALDAASSDFSTDARGGARVVDLPGVGTDYSVDLGAYELQALAQPTTPQAFVVTTMNDELDFNGPDASIESMGGLGDLSLREAIFLANHASGTADTITFDGTVFADATTNIVRLTMGEIEITDSLTIDGSTAELIVITGDANGDDVTLEGGVATDVDASSADLLDDNSRIFNISNVDTDVTLDSLAITGGRAPVSGGQSYGGGIYSDANSLTIKDSFIVGNTASGDSSGVGGGISAGSLTLDGSYVIMNSASGGETWGGGIAAGDVTITNSLVSENSVTGAWAGGGGLSASFATITSSTISNNSATGDYQGWGGGADGYDLTFVNSTVSGNIASSGSTAKGGGIGGYAVEIIHSTITGNSVDGGEEASGSGVIAYYVSTTNSIVLGNDDGTPGSAELTTLGTVTADGLNIIGTGADTDGSDGMINADPMAVFATTTANGAATAGVLSDNGGPVQTVALKLEASNPALDRAANTLAIDARGVNRVDLSGIGNAGVDFADLGAFEAQDLPPTALALTNKLAAIAEDRSTSSRIKVADIGVTDADGGPNTLSLAGADKALFEIFKGDLYLKAGAKLDFETNAKLDVTVQVSADLNGPGIDRTAAFSLKVIDVDEDPAGQRIVGTRHKDMLAGTSGHDTILGLANNDRISGNAGDDHITGGLGVDRMSGGSGDDTFVFRTIADFGPGYDGPIGNGIYSPARGAGMRDVVTDFQTGHDKLDVSAIDANVDQSGNQAFRFLGLGDMDVKGSLVYRTFDKAGTASDKTIVYGDIDGNGLADFQLELTGIHKLTASDFVL